MIKDAGVFAAVIAAFASLAVAFINYFGSRRTQKEVEFLKAELAERKTEKDARRDYEYEARKRLYHECEPLLFQLYEVSENALYRVYSLARTARSGDLDPENTWLNGPGYFMASTVYNLLAPVAVFKLIQSRLTFVDLAVEPHIKTQYRLAKFLYISFTDPFGFAALNPPICYDPDHPDWRELREKDPAKYWQQGFYMGELDFAAEGLILRQPSEPGRLRTFGEFATEYWSEDSASQGHFCISNYLFSGFHPRTRPVLWRIMIAQAHVYRALLEANRKDPAEITAEPMQSIPWVERFNLEWRQRPEEATDEQVLIEPFSAAEEYLRRFLERIVV